MPIQHLTDRDTIYPNFGLPRIGKIRKGAAKTEKGVGADLDHFRVTFEEDFSHLASVFVDMYGDEPKELQNVLLLGDAPEQALESWYLEHASNRLVHKCDGATQVQHYDNEEQRTSFEPIACARNTEHRCACVERGTLRLILPDFTQETGVWGFFQLETGSIYDIIKIHGYLSWIYSIRRSLTGVPFTIGRVKQEVNARIIDKKTNKPKRVTVDKHLLYIRTSEQYTKERLLPMLMSGVNAPDITRDVLPSTVVNMSTGEVVSTEKVLSNPVKSLSTGQENGQEIGQTGQALLTGQTGQDEPLDASNISWLRLWDYEELVASTSDLFDNQVHQMNAIRQMIDNGKLVDEMDTAQAIDVFRALREARNLEKIGFVEWTSDPAQRAEFMGVVSKYLRLNQSQTLRALERLQGVDRLSKLEDMKRVDKYLALAICTLTACGDNVDQALAKAYGNDNLQTAITQLYENAPIALKGKKK